MTTMVKYEGNNIESTPQEEITRLPEESIFDFLGRKLELMKKQGKAERIKLGLQEIDNGKEV